MKNLPQQLKKAVKQVKKRLIFTEKEQDEVKDRILRAVRHEKEQTVDKTAVSIWLPWWQEGFKDLQPVYVKTTGALLVLLLVISGVSWSAEAALPGELLYPVKTEVNERVMGVLTMDSESRARYETQLIERRLDEMAHLIDDNDITSEDLAKFEDRLIEHNERFNARLAQLSEQGRTKEVYYLSMDLESKVKDHHLVLSKVYNNVAEADHLSSVLKEQLAAVEGKRAELEQRLAEAEQEAIEERDKTEQDMLLAREVLTHLASAEGDKETDDITSLATGTEQLSGTTTATTSPTQDDDLVAVMEEPPASEEETSQDINDEKPQPDRDKPEDSEEKEQDQEQADQDKDLKLTDEALEEFFGELERIAQEFEQGEELLEEERFAEAVSLFRKLQEDLEKVEQKIREQVPTDEEEFRIIKQLIREQIKSSKQDEQDEEKESDKIKEEQDEQEAEKTDQEQEGDE